MNVHVRTTQVYATTTRVDAKAEHRGKSAMRADAKTGHRYARTSRGDEGAAHRNASAKRRSATIVHGVYKAMTGDAVPRRHLVPLINLLSDEPRFSLTG
jgi:hypothetical protein